MILRKIYLNRGPKSGNNNRNAEKDKKFAKNSKKNLDAAIKQLEVRIIQNVENEKRRERYKAVT